MSARAPAPAPKAAAFSDKQNVRLACLSLGEADVEINEGTADAPKREIVLTLLREGPGNQRDRRWYERACVEGVEGLVYSRRKVFKNHLAEGAPPASDKIEDWCATITQTWLVEQDGALVRKGRLKIHDDWLWERAKDPIARKELAVSIEGRGAGRAGEKNGAPFTCIESIIWLNAFKLVPYPGNASMGADTVEGAEAPGAQTTEEDPAMDLKTLTLSEIEAGRPDLIEAIAVKVRAKLDEGAAPAALTKLREELTVKFEESKKPLLASIETLTKSLTEANKKFDEADVKARLQAKAILIEGCLKESGLPPEAVTPIFRTTLSGLVEREVVDDKGTKKILSVEEQVRAHIADRKAVLTPAIGGPSRTGAALPAGVSAEELAAYGELDSSDQQFLVEQRVLHMHAGKTLKNFRDEKAGNTAAPAAAAAK